MRFFSNILTRRHFLTLVAQGVSGIALAQELQTRSSQADSFRIGFGSCLKNSGDAQILDRVVEADPQLFVWLGDNIYGDTENMQLLQKRYAVLGNNPRFQRLWNHCPNLAIWDDHDFGADNVGQEYPKKRESRAIFLDFWKVPGDDLRRSHEGIYGSYLYGEAEREVHMILLDNRSFRTRKNINSGSILGAAQWAWLEEELQKPSAVKIICSGIQVVSTEHGYEGWNEFPAERQRLFDLIKKYQVPGVLFVSGDQHWAEISKLSGALGYPAYDLTASSLDQYWRAPANSLRVGRAYESANFGMIIVEWSPTPILRLQILNGQGAVVEDQSVPLALLKP